MTLLNKIHQGTKKLHEETEAKDFLVRYRKNTHTLTDHFRHLSQLLPIYQTLEKKLKDPKMFIQLPAKLDFALERSEKIQQDLQFLKKHFSWNFDSTLLSSTKQYVAYLDKLDPEKNSLEIIGHFLTRILGDLFGGQKLKQYTDDLFARKNLMISGDQGTQFYQFEKGALHEVTIWLNSGLILIDDDELIGFMNQAFQRHIDLFDDLENNRLNLSSCTPFFKKAAIAAAATAGVAIALNYVL